MDRSNPTCDRGCLSLLLHELGAHRSLSERMYAEQGLGWCDGIIRKQAVQQAASGHVAKRMVTSSKTWPASVPLLGNS
eukprot:1160528-Pelagomonas_calceolata.AAC.3